MLYCTIDVLDESLLYWRVNELICNHVFNGSIAHYLVKSLPMVAESAIIWKFVGSESVPFLYMRVILLEVHVEGGVGEIKSLLYNVALIWL